MPSRGEFQRPKIMAVEIEKVEGHEDRLGRPWHIQLAIHPSDFDDIANAMMKLDRERALRAFANIGVVLVR